MVLNMEHLVSPTAISPSSLLTLSGIVDYTAIIVRQEVAGKSALTYLNLPISLFPPAGLLGSPSLHHLIAYMPSGFLIIEAKLSDPSSYVPQAVCEIYACGRFLQ